MRRFWLLAAGLLFLPLVGCTHETTPDEAMQVMSTGLANNKPQVAWEGLPPSYQQDVDGLVKDFSAKMDPEIWNGGFGIAKKVVRVLQEKKEYILKSPMLPLLQVDPKVLNENWDDVVKAVATVVNSDISELDKLRTLNINEFLSTTGADFMENMTALAEVSQQENLKNSMADYKNAKFSLLESEGDSAWITVEVPGEAPEKIQMVKVEEKWIPKDLADTWDQKITDAKKSLANIDTAQMEKNKEPLLATMNMIDKNLNLLLHAKSSEEFNGNLGTMAAMMMSMGGGGSGAPSTSFGGPSPSLGGDVDFGASPLGEDVPGEESLLPNSAKPKRDPFESATESDDPLFDAPATKPAPEESDSEAPAEAAQPE